MPATHPTTLTLARLRSHAIARSLFPPTTLARALRRMGYVQADPIRAPARAQDLILRHRVADYREGDLDRRYAKLAVEEDALVNYGFVHRDLQRLMHPRRMRHASRVERTHPGLLERVLDFVRARGVTHPRDLDADHGEHSVTNYWGGSSSAATHALDWLHYRGELRVVRREGGIRMYGPVDWHAGERAGPAGEAEQAIHLLERTVAIYAPVPLPTVRHLASKLRYGAPHLERILMDRRFVASALGAGRLRSLSVEGVDWIVPSAERIAGDADERVRFLAPFDPVVWDRRRFELFWGWRYRFEAYTPAARRKLGYYALPLLWRDRVIGWANVGVAGDRLAAQVGFAGSRPRDAAFTRELDAEAERFAQFMRTSKPPRISFVR